MTAPRHARRRDRDALGWLMVFAGSLAGAMFALGVALSIAEMAR